jgi:hypothetical protein
MKPVKIGIVDGAYITVTADRLWDGRTAAIIRFADAGVARVELQRILDELEPDA